MDYKSSLLIIDDDKNSAEHYCDILSDKYNVFAATSCKEAINFCQRRLPDIVLSDIVMPVKNGIDFLKEMKALCYESPIILITGHYNKDFLIEGIRWGAFDYLEKPLNLKAIHETLTRAEIFVQEQKRKIVVNNPLYDRTLSSSMNYLNFDFFARSIIHEISNPLSLIHLYIDESIEQSKLDHTLKNGSKLLLVKSALDRITHIVKNMKILNNHQQLIMEDIDFSELTKEILFFLDERIQQQNIKFIVKNTDVSSIIGNKIAISQVLINLINNAIDAIEKQPDKEIVLEAKKSDDFYVLKVTNSGPQIPAYKKNQLFLPSFSTKKSGNNLGLGLFISKIIIESHNGTIDVHSDGKKVNFSFTIPILKQHI